MDGPPDTIIDALRDAALRAFDDGGVAVAETDQHLSNCRMNRRAKGLIARSPLLSVHCSRIRFHSQTVRGRLLRAIDVAWHSDAEINVSLAWHGDTSTGARIYTSTYSFGEHDKRVIRLQLLDLNWRDESGTRALWQALWPLTARECDVAAELLSGADRREIGRRLGISTDGVKYHVKGLLAKTHAASRGDLIAKLSAASTQMGR